MRDTTPWLDRLMRMALAIPGWLLDRLDGRARPGLPADDPRPLFEQVREHRRHPEAYLALEDGLRHVLRPEGVLAYDRRGRSVFGVGGLNCAPGERVGMLRAYEEQARAEGANRLLMFPLRGDELADASKAGFGALQVGVEAWLDLDKLTFRGNRYGTVRQMNNRATKAGVTVALEDPAVAGPELQRVHDAWLATKRPSWRMRLLVGSLSLEHPFDRRYLVARRKGKVEGFVTLLPGGEGVWGIDVMCRRPDAVGGVMEKLIVEAVHLLQDEGVKHLSLGPCPMAGIESQPGRPVLGWIFRFLFSTEIGNRVFKFRNLYMFKRKFRPRWEPVYFGASPHLGWLSLYRGCRMWGLY